MTAHWRSSSSNNTRAWRCPWPARRWYSIADGWCIDPTARACSTIPPRCIDWLRFHSEEKMSARISAPFRADHVGSFLRPKFLLDAREQFKQNAISRVQLREVEDRAIRDVVRFQEDLGLQGVTDGEYRRTYFHIDFLEQLEGVTTEGGITVHFHKQNGEIDF